MSYTKFKVGDVVKFADTDYENLLGIVSVITRIDVDGHWPHSIIYTEDTNISGFFPSRFKLVTKAEVKPETTPEQKRNQVLQWIIEGKEIEVSFLPNAVGDSWATVDLSSAFSYFPDATYRLKPDEVPDVWHFLIYSKGKHSVSRYAYASEEELLKAYSYPVKVIQKIENAI